MYRFFIILITLPFLSCSKTDEEVTSGTTLASYVVDEEVIRDNVIACAASHENDTFISVFFYPRPGATNFTYFETDTIVDKNNFQNYSLIEFPIVDVFNGFLKSFEVSSDNEKWVVVTFEEDEMIHLSNPIRLKQNTKPTEYISQNVEVNTATTMPIFSWQDGVFDDTAIYFHVVSNAANRLLLGTYTFEQNFQYYNLDNVVLNVTPGTPPELIPADKYNFTLLGVSEDNWVNLLSEVMFQIE